MTQLQLDVPDEILLAEKTDAETFSSVPGAVIMELDEGRRRGYEVPTPEAGQLKWHQGFDELRGNRMWISTSVRSRILNLAGE